MNFIRSWILALVLVLGLTGIWEIALRVHGYTPSLRDDSGYWIAMRQRASDAGKDALVLVGASRMQLDVDVPILARLSGKKVIQLALDGSAPLPILEHLAADIHFRGTVICSVAPSYFHPALAREVTDDWINRYDNRSYYMQFEEKFKSRIQGSLSFLNPVLELPRLWNAIQRRCWPVIPYIVMTPDRSIKADYSLLDINVFRAEHEAVYENYFASTPKLTVEAFLAEVRKVADMAERIRNRGGKVIFVRMPSSGKIWKMESSRYPRTEYWDRFVISVNAPAFHFADFPELSGFTCPDSSHLDFRDVPAFTLSLYNILKPVL